MENKELEKLSRQINDLIELASALDNENKQLKSAAHLWQQERQCLIDNIKQARKKIKSMISQLRACLVKK